jgi:prepilin-type N-terminal cleavage/methylation domain-containing protein
VRCARGFTLIELVVVTATMAAVGGTFLTVASTIHRDERHAAACAGDVQDLTRAVAVLEAAVREARGPEDVPARLAGTDLYLGARRLARNVASFEVSWGPRLATVRVALGPRSDAPGRRRAALESVVLRRPREAGR